MKSKQLLIILFLLFYSRAQTTLSGNIGGMTFHSTGNPYIITGDIVVQMNKTTVIKTGCVFLFKPFTGLKIEGSIMVEGIEGDPVIFSTLHDGKYNPDSEQLPNPFDWNGILVSEHAGTVEFSYVYVAYSVFGIKSRKNALIINNGIFKQNGQYHFTVNDEIKHVVDDMPFTYGVEYKNKQSKKSISVLQKSAPYLIGSTGIVTGIFSCFSFKNYIDKKNEYENEFSPYKQKSIEEEGHKEATKGLILGSVTAGALPTAIILLIVGNKKKESEEETVSLLPSFDTESFSIVLKIGF